MNKQEKIAYIAGFTDGDGSITIYRNRNNVCNSTVSISQKARPTIEMLKQFCSELELPKPVDSTACDGMSHLNFNGHKGVCFLKRVGLYLQRPKLITRTRLYSELYTVRGKERQQKYTSWLVEKDISESTNPLPSELVAAWTAGFFDAEGSITISKQPRDYCGWAAISQKNEYFLTRVLQMLVDCGLQRVAIRPIPSCYGTTFDIRFSRWYGVHLLQLLLPFLYKKQTKAKFYIEFFSQRSAVQKDTLWPQWLQLRASGYKGGDKNENRKIKVG